LTTDELVSLYYVLYVSRRAFFVIKAETVMHQILLGLLPLSTISYQTALMPDALTLRNHVHIIFT